MENQVENEKKEQNAIEANAGNETVQSGDGRSFSEWWKESHEAVHAPFGMEDIPNDQWHDEWD